MELYLEVLPTAALAAEAAARRFALVAKDAIRARGKFVVVLSGGSTPKSAYAQLAMEPYASSIDWSCVHVFWSDERCVPPDDEASNYRMAREALLDHVPLLQANVHRIRGEDDPLASAASYERDLRVALRAPVGRPGCAPRTRIDLVLLGLGEDGHTASLFPGAESLDDPHRWVAARYLPAAAMWRVTLTPVIINAAAEVAFLVSGSAKAAVVREVLEGPHRPHHLPAQLIAPAKGRVRWILDVAAAAELRGDVGL